MDVARIIAESLAVAAPAASATATATKVPAPHSSFKFPNFDGTENKWVGFSRSVTQSLKMPCFASGSDTLVTTDTRILQGNRGLV